MADNFRWPQVHDFGSESTAEPNQNWHLSTTPNNDPSVHLAPNRRTSSAGLHKISPSMPTRTENNPSDRTAGASHRWRFNTNGQLVDSESAGWDLADEIVRLKIGEVTADSDEVHGHIRTPPKSKLATTAVAHLSDSSPLETSSDTSVGSSPHMPEHQISVSHSRGSSTDTTVSSSQESVASATSNTLLAKPPLKVNTGIEVKERPHSFSGGLSSADLRRLQQAGDGAEIGDRQLQQQWAQAQYRENMSATAEQVSYPSLATHIHRPQPQLHPQMYDYRGGNLQLNEAPAQNRDDPHIDYNTPQRNFNPIPQGLNLATPAAGPSFVQGRANNTVPGVAYRQPPRGFPQQGQIANPSVIPYAGGHVSHVSLGNTQQLYDMMIPGTHHEGHHAAVTRVQQQHNIFRPTHHHSASDPSAIRDASAIALLNNNMPPFGPGMFQPGMPLPMYPNQYFGAQEQYPLPDATVMAARLQAQYTGPYAVLPPQPVALEGSSVSSPTSTNGPGPSSNNRKLGLYKTELCRSWEEKGSCRYGTKCQFAHGEEELRKVSRHPKYKTEICRTFWVSGSCPYGKRCCFIHTELPTSGATAATASSGTPATDSAPQQRPDGRARSLSTNSDPNEVNVSILARISAKRGQDSNNLATPTDSGSAFQFSRPPTGSLRVDTSTLDTSVKQNKSAYPSFASNGILLPAPETVRAKSPGPVTAGPDLGRHSNLRREIVGYNNQHHQQQRTHKTNDSTSSSVHHSLNGSDVDVSFSASSPASGHSSFVLSTAEGGRVNGHVRAGSAGNWGSFPRNNHLAASAYPHGQSPAGDMGSSPWAPNDIQGVGASRLHEKVWA